MISKEHFFNYISHLHIMCIITLKRLNILLFNVYVYLYRHPEKCRTYQKNLVFRNHRNMHPYEAWTIYCIIKVHQVPKIFAKNGYYCGILAYIKRHLINKWPLINKKIFLFFFKKKFDFDPKRGL